MPFALTPSDGPPRLFRFFEGGEDMSTAVLDRKNNLLFINRTKYDRLAPWKQEALLRTHQEITP